MNGSYKFKKSGSANAAEKRNRTDSEGRSGFGASTPTPVMDVTKYNWVSDPRTGQPMLSRSVKKPPSFKTKSGKVISEMIKKNPKGK